LLPPAAKTSTGSPKPTAARTPEPDPAPPRQPPPPAKPPPPHSKLASLKPVAPTSTASQQLTDDEIGKSIQRGVDFLLSQFSQTRLSNADNYDPEVFAGLNALCAYALLHAGESISDERLAPQGALMKEVLARVKEFPMSENKATYSRSLRIAALAVHDRPEDRSAITRDAEWLIASSIQGAFTYGKPADKAQRSAGGWDNSNSQYGALGIWAATEVGFRATDNFWREIESHWTDAQTQSGGWGYGPGATDATLAMTAAGVSALFTAREQLGGSAGATAPGGLTKALARGLEWLDEGDNAINIGGHPGYTLYGIERAGLASGYKFFGRHDWYTALASRQIRQQNADGSWDGTDGKLAETAFNILFLARGRHPVFMSKLRFDGNWANRSRDVANLTRFASRELERQLNWQTVGLERQWFDWADSSVLFIASDQPANFSDEDLAKLRAFVEAGGLIFTHADKNSQAFTGYVASLAARLFPEYPLRELPKDHLIYSTVFKQDTRPTLLGVSNGSRLLMVHSPTDLARHWLLRPLRSNRPSYETAVNVVVYATGRRDFRNRVTSLYVPEFTESTIGTIPIARLRYEGNWDPEPGAWTRMSRLFPRTTSIALDPIVTDTADLQYQAAPFAHLTGTGAIALRDDQIDALRQFVTAGGVLLIEPCGGSKEFTDSVNKALLAKLLPSSVAEPIPSDHAIFDGLGKAKYRAYAIETRGTDAGGLRMIAAGAGAVIVSDLDISGGLLGPGTWGIAGFQPDYAQGLVRNMILWTLSRLPKQ